MSCSKEVYPQGKIRYFRLASMLHDEGKPLLSLYFKTYFTGKTLDVYLKEPANKNIIDSAFKKQILYPDQYALLYPAGGTPDIEHFDITLLVFLIRSLHNSIPVNDVVWKTPSPTDRSAEATVTRLKDIRNKLWGHIYELNISETDFQSTYSQLLSLLKDLAREIAHPLYTADVVQEKMEMKSMASMDPDAENRLLVFLQTWKTFDKQQDHLNERLEEIDSKIQKLTDHLCVTKEVCHVATNTGEDQDAEIQQISGNTDETVYENSEQKVTVNKGNKYMENVPGIVKKDASTSTSSLEKNKKINSRIWNFVMPFIGSPRPAVSATQPQSCHSRSRRIDHARLNRHRISPFSRLSCARGNRKFSHLSKIQTDRHDHVALKCFISGLAHLMNGLLVIIDTTHNFIQVFDQWNVLIDLHKCDFPIKNICAVHGDKNVAITLYKDQAVALFEITRRNGVRYLETIFVHCEGWLNDVKYSNGRLYTLCDRAELHIHHFRGKHVPDDIIKFDIGVQPLSFDISTSDDLTFLYIVYGSGILCFTDTGKELWEHIPKQGAYQDLTQIYRHEDKLYVSSWGTDRIMELTLGGKWIRDIGVGASCHPWAVDVSCTGEQLFVSQYSVSQKHETNRDVLIFS